MLLVGGRSTTLKRELHIANNKILLPHHFGKYQVSVVWSSGSHQFSSRICQKHKKEYCTQDSKAYRRSKNPHMRIQDCCWS